jgi:hypothetical protein
MHGHLDHARSFSASNSALNRLQENSGFRLKLTESVPPGLKPLLILFALCGG